MDTQIGIDVSKKSLDACVLQGNAKPRHRKFENRASGFKDLEAWVLRQSPSGPWHFCLEATGPYGFGVAEHLCEAGRTVSVENPRRVKHFAIAANLKAKTDKVDAFCIALYTRRMEPREWALKDPLLRELAFLRTRLRQIGKAGRAERSRLENERLPEVVRTQIHRHRRFLASEEKEVDARIRELMAESPTARTVYTAVTGINGVGPDTGLLLTTLDVESFDEAKDVAAHFGLNPNTRESGEFKGTTRISKAGDSAARAAFVSAAAAAVKSNPVLKAFLDILMAKGLSRKRATVAVARKLVMIAWGVARNALRGLPVHYPGGELRGTNLRVFAPGP